MGLRTRRRKAEPEELTHKFAQIPVDRREHVEPDNLDRDEAAQQGCKASPSEIDGTDLRLAELAHPVAEPGHPDAGFIPSG